MEKDEHLCYRQFFDWKTIDGHGTNIYARLSELIIFSFSSFSKSGEQKTPTVRQKHAVRSVGHDRVKCEKTVD